MGIGKQIEAAMIRANKKPVDIARHLNITESAVSQWFAKDAGPKTARLGDLAEYLETTVDFLTRDTAPTQGALFSPREPQTADAASSMRPSAPTRPDLPVWAAVEGGEDGAIIITSEPIDYIWRPDDMIRTRDGWAFYVIGSSMSPAIDHGDLVVVNPAKPIKGGVDCVFVHEQEDGTLLGMVKRLVRANSDRWTVKQFEPAKQFDLSRKKWAKAWRIVEKRYG